MTDKKASLEWVGPIVIGVGTHSAVVSMGVLLAQVVPVDPGVVVVACVLIGIATGVILRRNRLLGRGLSPSHRSAAQVVVALCMTAVIFVGGRLTAGPLMIPTAKAAH